MTVKKNINVWNSVTQNSVSNTERHEDVGHVHSMALLTGGRERDVVLLLNCMIPELCCQIGDQPCDF